MLSTGISGHYSNDRRLSNRSFVLQDIRKFGFENRIVIPGIHDDREVRVHIAQTGICGSDVHYWQRGRIGDFIIKSPIVLGHESAGTVVEIGSAVSSLKVGDRVAIEPGTPCRYCDYCRSGAYNLCPDTIFAATPPHDGTLSEVYSVAEDYCYKLPEHVTFEEGAMAEPLAVAVQVCKVADVKAGQKVVVFGAGPIGALCQAVCKVHGATTVIAVDISQSRLDFAKTFGADGIYKPVKPEPGADPIAESQKTAEAIKEEFELGDGADVVLECTGAESCIQAGIFVARKGGTYVQTGMGRENVLFPITTTCIRGLNIKGSIRYTTGCYPQAIKLIASGKIMVRRLITNRFKFEDAEKAFELVKRGEENVLKVMIEGMIRKEGLQS